MVKDLARLLALWTGFVTLTACAAPTAPVSVDTTRTYIDELTGLSFALPADWIDEEQGETHIFSGAAGTPAFFTTLTLQQVTGVPLALDAALDEAFERVETLPQFAWEDRSISAVDGWIGLRYSVQFEYNEALQRKAGILLIRPPFLIDLSYGADDDLFNRGLPVFENALRTLALAKPN